MVSLACYLKETCLTHISNIRSNVALPKSTVLAVLASFHLPRPGSGAKSRCCPSFESGRDQCVFKGEPQLLLGCSWGQQEPALLVAGGPLLPGASSCCCCPSSPLLLGGCALWWNLRFGHFRVRTRPQTRLGQRCQSVLKSKSAIHSFPPALLPPVSAP